MTSVKHSQRDTVTELQDIKEAINELTATLKGLMEILQDRL